MYSCLILDIFNFYAEISIYKALYCHLVDLSIYCSILLKFSFYLLIFKIVIVYFYCIFPLLFIPLVPHPPPPTPLLPTITALLYVFNMCPRVWGFFLLDPSISHPLPPQLSGCSLSTTRPLFCMLVQLVH